MVWITSALLDIAVIQSGSGFPKKYQGISGEKYPFYKVSDMNLIGNEESLHFENNTISAKTRDILKPSLFSIGSIVFPKVGAAIATNKKRILTKVGCVDNNIMGAIPKEDKVYPRFLFYWFQQQNLSEFANEAALPSIKKTTVEAWPISYPDSIPEQKRIVSILDTVFADLEQTRAKTEQNLKNARELFDSYLQQLFSQGGEGWKNTTVGAQITLQRGFDITKKMQNSGTVPVVSSGGIKSFHDTNMAYGPGVVIGRKGSLGTVYYLDENYWPHDTTLWVKDFKGNEPKLVYYLFLGLDVKSLDSGTANPALNRNLVHPIKISWPDINRQKQLISNLDLLTKHIKCLEEIYREKLNAIDELKKSILQKAFSGELTNTAE